MTDEMKRKYSGEKKKKSIEKWKQKQKFIWLQKKKSFSKRQTQRFFRPIRSVLVLCFHAYVSNIQIPELGQTLCGHPKDVESVVPSPW